jgi:hypothetical protein
MDDGAGPVTRECRIERSRVENIALHQRTPAHELDIAFRQVVECDRQEPVCGQGLASLPKRHASSYTNHHELRKVDLRL